MSHDPEEKKQKQLALQLKKLFRDEAIKREEQFGKFRNKVINAKPSNRKNRRSAKKEINRYLRGDEE